MVAALAAFAVLDRAAGHPRGDPSARLATGGSATEYWDVTAAFDSRHFLFARFLITNEGPGKRTGVGMGRLIGPDGEVTEFQYGRRAADWSVSPDGLRIKVASSVLDLGGSTRSLEIDSDKRGIEIRVEFSAAGDAVWTEEPPGFDHRLDVVQMPTPAEASIQVGGMSEPLKTRGWIGVTHAWMDRGEADLLARRIEFVARHADFSLYVADLVRPDGRRWRWMALARAGRVVFRRQDFGLTVEGRAAPKGEAGYSLPQVLRLDGEGFRGAVTVERELLRSNPLGLVPQPFRFLLAFKSSPRQLWAEARFTLNLALEAEGSGPLPVEGRGVLAVHYLNPMK
jgi:hypothetical protein